MRQPEPRGPLSEILLERLLHSRPAGSVRIGDADAVTDDDLQLALYLCYELHYAGVPGADPRLEWDPAVLSFRRILEDAFESALMQLVPRDVVQPRDALDLLADTVKAKEGSSLSAFIEERATLDQVHEFVIHRSAYQLKEADPHSWIIPRLRGGSKASLVEIQSDEYGGGRPDRVHSILFARAMDALGLDPTYGAYIDLLPGITLATVNLVSMFGLHRRWRGAAVGHLAAFEATSAAPNRRYAKGLRRLGVPDGALDFYDEHVEADSVHEVIALHDLAGGLMSEEPELASDVVFGARSLMRVEDLWSAYLLERWGAGAPSLRRLRSGAAHV